MNWKNKTYYTDLSAELQQQIKTERQWAKSGYLPLGGVAGKPMYPNRNSTRKYQYYHQKDVYEASKEELDTYFAPERARRREMDRRRKMKEIRQGCEVLYSEKHQLETDLDRCRVNYRKLCKQLAGQQHSKEVVKEKTIVLDIETTGLDPLYDEILELSILDADTAEVLYNQYFRPFRLPDWKEARAVNHITADMVKDQPFFASEVPAIQRAFDSAKVIIGYNPSFDIDFLKSYGLVCYQEQIDVMLMFAAYNGERDEVHGGYRWKKLTECAAALGYVWDQRGAHDSLADCSATLYSYKKLLE